MELEKTLKETLAIIQWVDAPMSVDVIENSDKSICSIRFSGYASDSMWATLMAALSHAQRQGLYVKVSRFPTWIVLRVPGLTREVAEKMLSELSD